jgi:hypothetical protein
MKSSLLLSMLSFFSIQLVIAQDHSASNMQHSDSGHIAINKADLKWVDAPPSLPKGAKVAVLVGDPSKEGLFTMRLMFPENYKVAPHWHPTAEHITVIEGTFYMGSGEKFDEGKATQLQEEGYSVMPAEMRHYAFTKGNAVIQVHAMGPFAITYVNPADDPRPKK